MTSFQETLKFASLILQELSSQSNSRTELEIAATQKLGSHARFDGMLKFLVQNGYVRKCGSEHRSPYCITVRGGKLLEALV